MTEAKERLNDALANVAFAARGVRDNANVRGSSGWNVQPEDMTELSKALAGWDAASENFMEVVEQASADLKAALRAAKEATR